MGSKTELIDLIKNLSENKAKEILDKIKEENEITPDSDDCVDNKNADEKDANEKGEHPLKKLFGIWEGRNITLKKIREKAWRKK